MSDAKQAMNPLKPLLVGFVSLGVLVFGLGAWAAIANISGAVISSGAIEVEGNRQPVQHPDGGVVGEILVKDGDVVEAGQVLVRFDGTLMRSELAIIEGQLFEIMSRKARLQAEAEGRDDLNFDPELIQLAETREDVGELMIGQERLFVARQITKEQQAQQLREQLEQVKNQISGTEAQIAALSEQRALIDQELGDQVKLLDQGLTQQSRVLALQREAASLGGTLGELQANLAQAKGQIAEIEIQILRLDADLSEQALTTLRDMQFRENELRERRLSMIETLSRLELRAPVTGIIYGRAVNSLRSVVKPADTVMFIVPQDEPLVISTRVEAIHIDQVHVGQEATLRFPAFDQRTTPEVFGSVTKVSPDVFKDEATGISYYSAEIIPYDEELPKIENLLLLPGMPVEAFIKTGDRTPLAYLIKPLSDYFNKAFRET